MGNLRLPVFLRSSDFLEKIVSVCLSNYISLNGKQILIGLLSGPVFLNNEKLERSRTDSINNFSSYFLVF